MAIRSSKKGNVSYRPAGPSDLRRLTDHRHRMWTAIGHRTEREITAHDRGYGVWLRPRLRSREVVGFVALGEGRSPVGSGLVWFRPDQPRPGSPKLVTPYILSMFTEPAWRGHGIATSIVRRLVSVCREEGYPSVVLHASEEGRSVYARLGFERTWEMRYWVDPAVRRRRARWTTRRRRKPRRGWTGRVSRTRSRRTRIRSRPPPTRATRPRSARSAT